MPAAASRGNSSSVIKDHKILVWGAHSVLLLLYQCFHHLEGSFVSIYPQTEQIQVGFIILAGFRRPEGSGREGLPTCTYRNWRNRREPRIEIMKPKRFFFHGQHG